MERLKIPQVVSRGLVPLILLFALYVQFHGDFGPGGGFQAGVIFSAAIILYGMVFGVERCRAALPPLVLRVLAGGGVLLYGGVGVAGMLLGGRYLDYDVLAAAPTAGQHLGILLVEFGVGTTVASVMLLLFYAFSDRMWSDDA